MSVNIYTTTGYMRLDSWVMAHILQLGTMSFCRRFIGYDVDPKGRWLDQMTQAARSVTANVAEGSARHQTSLETEMKLVDVARASLNELANDFMFWLMLHDKACWSCQDSSYNAVRQLRLDKPDYDADDLRLREAMIHIMSQRKRFSEWIDNDDAEVCANALLVLCQRLMKMLDHQIEGILNYFRENGGFAENMTQERLEARKEKSVNEGAPKCPICGKPMLKKTAKRGMNSGHQFWSCSDYPKCNGTRSC